MTSLNYLKENSEDLPGFKGDSVTEQDPGRASQSGSPEHVLHIPFYL